MQISSVRFWLFQLRANGVHRNIILRQFRQKAEPKNVEFKADPRVLALRDKLLYCDYLDYETSKLGYVKRKEIERKQLELAEKERYEKIAYQPAVSVLLNNETEEKYQNVSEKRVERKPLHMPYAMVDTYELTDARQDDVEEIGTDLLNEKQKDLYGKHLDGKKNDLSDDDRLGFENSVKSSSTKNIPNGELSKVPRTWMFDYEQFDDTMWYTDYGTPDPNIEVSSVPCGGCGALLHCKDPAIPGYLPSELFLYKNDEDLKSMICQRCHFLKFYNAALEVKVSIDDYPKLLRAIKSKKCAIILIIDLTDFPCSIWPDLKSILHPFTPIYLVGNKVDLLPRDCPMFFENVKQLLLDTVVNVTGVKKEYIAHVQLTSAKTGYGIEQLINKLQHKWRHNGDVYLIGCTNVGKSSLFNALLNSDYCKVQAVDLVQRATVSAWPGTTLNLLKFPILNPTSKKLHLRVERLKRESVNRREMLKYRDYQYKLTRNMKFATLEDNVGKTFSMQSEEQEVMDPFSEKSHKFMLRKPVFDESKPEYEHSRWCYDTPGTVQRDQILDLLTTDELLLTLPPVIISPRTFILKEKQTVFVAGLGRLDYLEGESFIRCTLFASKELPLTICYTADADEVYDRLLETEVFVVPKNDPPRLMLWPKLGWKEMKVTGVNHESAADVVLSSTGWIAVTPHENESVSLRAWTPQARGIHLRCPALLRKSVYLCGPRVQGKPVYLLGRKIYVKS